MHRFSRFTRRPSYLRLTSLAATLSSALLASVLLAPAPTYAEDPHVIITNDLDAAGTTHIGAGVNADMSIGPTILTVTLDLTTKEISDGVMPIPSRVVTFSVFGIPTRATVTMTQKTPLTGQLSPTGIRAQYDLDAAVSYDIRLSNVQARMFGIWWPLAVGSNCHTIDPVQINAHSPEGRWFMLTQGGPATATYTIGNFTGCTPLNFFDIPGFFPTFGSVPINAIVPGSNNTLDLELRNPRKHEG